MRFTPTAMSIQQVWIVISTKRSHQMILLVTVAALRKACVKRRFQVGKNIIVINVGSMARSISSVGCFVSQNVV